jgi:cyanophycinase
VGSLGYDRPSRTLGLINEEDTLAGPGPLAIAGGEEFMPGNEPQDELLVRAAQLLAEDLPAFVIATAAARQSPERAVETAQRWFAGLGLDVVELPVRTRGRANSTETAELARSGRFVYLCGGDPGFVPVTLAGTAGWAGILDAWRAGAPLAGSSAGAMALGEWTLIRSRMPGDSQRQPREGLAVLPRVAVLPHFDDFGERWIDSATAVLVGRDATLLGIDARSAAVWVDGTWRAMGRGAVTVIDAHGGRRRFGPGETIAGLAAPLVNGSGGEPMHH